MVSKVFNDKRSCSILSLSCFDLFACLCQFFCSVTSVFFFQQVRKFLLCDCYMEDHNFSLCEVIEDIVEEMKVKDRGERGNEWRCRNRRNNYISPQPLPAARTAGLAQL